MTEHTPTPWMAIGKGDIKSVCKGFPETMVAKVLGQPTRIERSANAAFIIKAVNSHDALVKALEKIKQLVLTNRTHSVLDEVQAICDEALLADVSTPPGSGK